MRAMWLGYPLSDFLRGFFGLIPDTEAGEARGRGNFTFIEISVSAKTIGFRY